MRSSLSCQREARVTAFAGQKGNPNPSRGIFIQERVWHLHVGRRIRYFEGIPYLFIYLLID